MKEQDEAKINKEFKQRDVQRMRNIITKKFGDKTTIQVGYKRSDEDHQEGDIWTENGKEWTIKDGIKQTNTKLDDFKKSMFLPLVCPKCKNHMGSRLDKKMYPLHHTCFNCVVEMETKLKMEGRYQEYCDAIISGNLSGFIKDAKEFIHDFVNDAEVAYYTEMGDKEEFHGAEDKNKIAKEWIKELDEMEKQLESKKII